MDLFDAPGLWRALQESELSRAIAIAAILTYAANVLKPYLPTGSKMVEQADDGTPYEAVENRWLPLVVLLFNTALNPIVALYFNSRGASQDALFSTLLGFLLGLASIGAARGIKLSTKGDVAEQKNLELNRVVRAKEGQIRSMERSTPINP